jgi:hypothetical protein
MENLTQEQAFAAMVACNYSGHGVDMVSVMCRSCKKLLLKGLSVPKNGFLPLGA